MSDVPKAQPRSKSVFYIKYSQSASGPQGVCCLYGNKPAKETKQVQRDFACLKTIATVSDHAKRCYSEWNNVRRTKSKRSAAFLLATNVLYTKTVSSLVLMIRFLVNVRKTIRTKSTLCKSYCFFRCRINGNVKLARQSVRKNYQFHTCESIFMAEAFLCTNFGIYMIPCAISVCWNRNIHVWNNSIPHETERNRFSIILILN